MLIRAGHELKFSANSPLAMLLMLHVHPSRQEDVTSESFRISPEVPTDEFSDSFGNRCTRIAVPAGEITIHGDHLVLDSGKPDFENPLAVQNDVQDLPLETLQFLLASRYCEVDGLTDIAWKLFGNVPAGWAKVQAVCDWVHENVSFGYQHARCTKTAKDVYEERTGVCRDFTHLAVTFCRALNIPARYCTGYLGDICVPVAPFPMDFSAWFEVYLGDRWYTFDARHNRRRVGRIVMARGRDAVDVALTTSFGEAKLTGFMVWTDEVQNSNGHLGDLPRPMQEIET
jgi:transglutaminase-like putative cysteine protease